MPRPAYRPAAGGPGRPASGPRGTAAGLPKGDLPGAHVGPEIEHNQQLQPHPAVLAGPRSSAESRVKVPQTPWRFQALGCE